MTCLLISDYVYQSAGIWADPAPAVFSAGGSVASPFEVSILPVIQTAVARSGAQLLAGAAAPQRVMILLKGSGPF